MSRLYSWSFQPCFTHRYPKRNTFLLYTPCGNIESNISEDFNSLPFSSRHITSLYSFKKAAFQFFLQVLQYQKLSRTTLHFLIHLLLFILLPFFCCFFLALSDQPHQLTQKPYSRTWPGTNRSLRSVYIPHLGNDIDWTAKQSKMLKKGGSGVE